MQHHPLDTIMPTNNHSLCKLHFDWLPMMFEMVPPNIHASHPIYYLLDGPYGATHGPIYQKSTNSEIIAPQIGPDIEHSEHFI